MNDQGTPYVPQRFCLSSGMEYIRIYVPEADTVQVQIMVRAGSRDETPATAGYAHALEHFFFKGCKGYPNAYAINDTIERNGGSANAFTGTEMVSYYASGLKHYVHSIARVITRMVTQPTFPAAEWHNERNTVLEELSSYAAEPISWMGDAMVKAAFGGDQPMAWSAGGVMSVVATSEVPALVDYYGKFYDPHKMAVIIGGGATLDPAEVERLVEKMPPGKNPPRVPATWGAGELYVGKTVTASARGQQTRIMLNVPGVPSGTDQASEARELAFDLLAAVLSCGDSSRLRTMVRHQPGLASDMEAFHQAFQDAGVFTLYMTTSPGMQERAVRFAMGEVARLAAEPPSAAELARARIQIATSILARTEEATDLVSHYAGRWGAGKELLSPAELVARHNCVTAADVSQAARQVMAGQQQLRLVLVHPADPLTGRNAKGQTLSDAADRIRKAALSVPLQRSGMGLA